MTFNTAYYACNDSIVVDAHRFMLEYSDLLDDNFLSEWLPWSIRAPLGGLGVSTVAVSFFYTYSESSTVSLNAPLLSLE